MSKGDGAVMRILLGDEDVVEAAHFGMAKDADAAEGLGCSRQDFTLSDVGPQLSAVLWRRKVIGLSAMSPSRVPRVMSGVPPSSKDGSG